MIATPAPSHALLRLGPTFAFFVVAMWLALVRVVTIRIYNDEQLFLGGAGLMARGEGLLHRDFFYNHMPTQALLMAGLFRVTDHWALAARAFDATCGALLATLLFEAARRAFVETSPLWRAAMATAVGVIFLFNPVTADAVGKAWNHDLAALAAMAGLILLAVGLGKARPIPWVIASGACAAIAATTRLTYAPPMVCLPLLILLAPGFVLRARFRLLAFWTLGSLLAAAPALWVLLQSPSVSYFSNVQFPRYNILYFSEAGRLPRGTLKAKFWYAQSNVGRSLSLQVIFWLSLAATLIAIRPWRVRTSLVDCRFVCLTVVLAAACFAAFVPTPMFHQYLYGPVPFAVLAIVWGSAKLGIARRWWSRVALLAAAAICVASGWENYRSPLSIFRPKTWTPNVFHEDSKRLAQAVGNRGKVLTFTPGLALEAGLPIYPELSIGRFTLRIGHFLNEAQRTKYKIPDIDDVRGWFESDPPAAVLLLDPRSKLDSQIANIARSHGYTPRSFGAGRMLYLPPTSTTRATTQLTTEPTIETIEPPEE